MASKPPTQRCFMVRKLTTNFREAVVLETVDICQPQENEVCIKNKYVGVNAVDINMTKGRYFVSGKVPFGVGCEGVGEIVEIGEKVNNLKVGQCVGYMTTHFNAYAEYACVRYDEVFPIPEPKPEYLGLFVSGLSVRICLEKAARLTAGETVLITTAAGGSGHTAVQWAKAAGCYVIGICSTEDKEAVLKELGCDHVINYKKENLDEVLGKQYKKGIDVIWEAIGGEIFQTCLKHIATKGRLVVYGYISNYQNEEKHLAAKMELSFLPELLLQKSVSIQGFVLPHYRECYNSYFKLIRESFEKNQLKIILDNGERATGSEFFGFEGIIKGVEHLYSRKSIGKIIVRMY